MTKIFSLFSILLLSLFGTNACKSTQTYSDTEGVHTDSRERRGNKIRRYLWFLNAPGSPNSGEYCVYTARTRVKNVPEEPDARIEFERKLIRESGEKLTNNPIDIIDFAESVERRPATFWDDISETFGTPYEEAGTQQKGLWVGTGLTGTGIAVGAICLFATAGWGSVACVVISQSTLWSGAKIGGTALANGGFKRANGGFEREYQLSENELTSLSKAISDSLHSEPISTSAFETVIDAVKDTESVAYSEDCFEPSILKF